MAISIDFATSVITINQSDLTLISGDLYELPTEDTFRAEVNALMDDEIGIVFEDPIRHNTEVTIVGVTYARFIELINGYSVTFENLTYTVRLAQSNNNLFDVENGILNASGNVTVVGQNSAGKRAPESSRAGAMACYARASAHISNHGQSPLGEILRSWDRSDGRQLRVAEFAADSSRTAGLVVRRTH